MPRHNFIETVNDLRQLRRSEYSALTKIRIFLTYLRLTAKFWLAGRIFLLKTEQMFGFRISCFKYETLRFLFQEIFVRGEYYFEADKKEVTIFDCGGNIGLSTLYFKWLYPQSKIYVFEPDPQTFELLKKNIKQNKLENVFLHNVALLDKNGEIDFFIDKEKPGSLTMSTTFERLPKDVVRVKTISLAEFIKQKVDGQKIEFVKMDIEGDEEKVLVDLDRRGILKNIQELIIEFHLNIGDRSTLSNTLRVLENNGFNYQLTTKPGFVIYAKNEFQDILVYAYQRDRKDWHPLLWKETSSLN